MISKVLETSIPTVSRLIAAVKKHGIHFMHRCSGRIPKFAYEHYAFLAQEATLDAWAEYSLQQRAVLFHRRFPEVRISKSHLHRIYNKLKIKHKVIKLQKPSA